MSSSTSGCILCFNYHKFQLSHYTNANGSDHSLLCVPPSLTVTAICSVTECSDFSASEPMLHWRQNAVFIQEQFAGKHPELEIVMMGGLFPLLFSPTLFAKQFNKGWNAIKKK